MSLDGHWLEKPKQLLFFLLQSKKPHSVIALFSVLKNKNKKGLQWGQAIGQKEGKAGGRGGGVVQG